MMNPVNDAPVLTIADKTVVQGTLLTFAVTATDPDAGQTKTFALITPPSGATINAAPGVFSWTPATIGTFTIKVRVTDNGAPALFCAKTLAVTVTAPAVRSTATVSNTTSSKQKGSGMALAKAVLYPNPVTNQLTVRFGAPVQQALVTIGDRKGAVIYNKIQAVAGRQIQLDATTFRSGAYFMQLQTILRY